ncbi:MAG: TauD/TfdA family dioxygenase [Pseudomonadota bacterium]
MAMTVTDFNPFDLAREADYRTWRAWKLDAYPARAADLRVEIGDPGQLTAEEHAAILAVCRKANMALYAIRAGSGADKAAIRALGRQFGLEHLDMNLRADEDSITSLRVLPQQAGTHYIPYTNRPLSWHTDGYYNSLDEQVRAIVLHCVSAAASGGESLLLDHEIAYLLLRDENPAWIRALMQPDVMTIPANVEEGRELRGAQTGPVFAVANGSHALHMRYTARTRSIVWKDDPDVRAAVQFLRELLDSELPWIFRYRLRPGEGIICNNVLHRRLGFDDAAGGAGRLLYRARYHDRIRDTVAHHGFYGGRQCCG